MRLIDADALKKAILGDIDTGDNVCDTGYLNAMYMCLEYIENAPTVEEKSYAMGYQDGAEDGLQEIRPHGKWLLKQKYNDDAFEYCCSRCGRRIFVDCNTDYALRDYPYCNCGAKMEGGEHG